MRVLHNLISPQIQPRPWTLVLLGLLAFLTTANTANAQISAAPGYAIKRVDGDNDLGEHFAIAPVGSNQHVGFYYFADQQALYSGTCTNGACRMGNRLTALGDRGRFPSAAALPGLSNRFLVAYFDQANQDLRAGLCESSTRCDRFLTDRILDSAADVGQHIAIAINPATGFALISYYASNLGDARVYACSNADCSTGSAQSIETGGDVGVNSALAFGANLTNFTNAFIVYDNRTSGQIRFARGVTPFSSFSPVDLAPGSNPSINVGASGFPDIVFRGANDSLTHIRCLSFDCTGANQILQTLAGAGKGFAPSIARLANGNVFITALEPATNTLFGYVCTDVTCAAPQILTLETRLGIGGVSVASSYADGRPAAFYQDADAKDVRVADCTSVACSTLQQRIAANGSNASLPNVAARQDGRAVAIWLRDRTPIMGICNDANCTAPAQRPTAGANSDIRPSIVVRPDNRPFAYYSSVGGTAAWDCADADCTSGTARFVSGSGNSTSNVAKLALRTDGIPVMLYFRNSTNEVFVYVCGDVNCSTGTERTISTEPASSFLTGFALSIGAGNRPVVTYIRANSGFSAIERRLWRCNDADCLSAASTLLNTSPGFAADTPMILQSSGAPTLLDSGVNSAELVSCSNSSCNGLSVQSVPGSVQTSLAIVPGDIAVYDGNSAGAGRGFFTCANIACTSTNFRSVIQSTPAIAGSFSGAMMLNALSQPVLAIDESNAQDVWIAVPSSDNIFRNGFE